MVESEGYGPLLSGTTPASSFRPIKCMIQYVDHTVGAGVNTKDGRQMAVKRQHGALLTNKVV